MKLSGHDLSRESVEIVPLPRGYDVETGQKLPDIIFRCKAVRSFDPFLKQVKEPEPPHVVKPGGVKEYNYDDPTYFAQLTKYNRIRYDYIVLTSLTATEGLEWDTVKMSDPATWSNWEKELESAGFTTLERNKIQDGVMRANSISNARIEEALANFLRGQEAQ
jgi:hypothetical protein